MEKTKHWWDVRTFDKNMGLGPKNQKWWQKVATDKHGNRNLIISILTTILMSGYATMIWTKNGDVIIFWSSCAVSAFCFITSQLMMYQLYMKKIRHENSGWNKLKDRLVEPILLAKVHNLYRESLWIQHTPPFALFLYVELISICEVHIFLELNSTDPLYLWILVFMFSVAIIITIKFCNDVYNLLNNCKKMQGLDKDL